jgi:hypothetical protein
VRSRGVPGHRAAARRDQLPLRALPTSTDVGDVEIDDVEGQLTWFEPVDEAAYAFCRRCGSSLFWQGVSTPDRISIAAGTLELPTGLRTVEAWWVSEASDYHERPHVAERATE